MEEVCEHARSMVEGGTETTNEKLSARSSIAHFRNLFFASRRPHGKTEKKLAEAAEILELILEALRKEGIHYNLQLVETLAGCEEPREDELDCYTPYHKEFRSIDGVCNNQKHPFQGAVHTPHRRLAPATYENGVNEPRGWNVGKLHNGFPLPSPRLVATTVAASDEFDEDNRYSEMLMQWGQFLDHDMALTPFVDSLVSFETGVDCEETCDNDYPCFPIPTPAGDPRIPEDHCIGVIRSAGICHVDPFEPYVRNQINILTSYLDAGNVYGSTEDVANALRELEPVNTGRLRVGVTSTAGKPLLPIVDDNTPDHSVECLVNLESDETSPCFFAGDARVNDQIALTAMHTIWMREHNRIADRLAELHPEYDGDRIYNEARKIVGGIHQVITFKEWLPKILGRRGFNEIPDYEGYDPSLDATVSNEFATASYRMGHGLIRPFLHRLDENCEEVPEGNIALQDAFFAPERFFDTNVDALLRGLFCLPAKMLLPQRMVTEVLTENLFEMSFDIALDLVSLNIQRGRDHGIATYNDMREICGLGRAYTFDDLKDDIPRRVLRSLEEVYKHPDNIDLWPGGMSERRTKGGRVGPTISCVLREQFTRLRDGDRFWYENEGVFTRAQRRQIRKASLARVVCDNGDNIDRVQPDIFTSATVDEMVPCDELPFVDLDKWA